MIQFRRCPKTKKLQYRTWATFVAVNYFGQEGTVRVDLKEPVEEIGHRAEILWTKWKDIPK